MEMKTKSFKDRVKLAINLDLYNQKNEPEFVFK